MKSEYLGKRELYKKLKLYMPGFTSKIGQCSYLAVDNYESITGLYGGCLVMLTSFDDCSWHILSVYSDDENGELLRREVIKVWNGEVVREDITQLEEHFEQQSETSGEPEAVEECKEENVEEFHEVENVLPFPEVADRLPFEEVPLEELYLEPMDEKDAELVRLTDENNILHLEVALLKIKIDCALSQLKDIVSFSSGSESDRRNQRRISLAEAILCHKHSHGTAYDLAESGELPAQAVSEEFERLDALTCAWGC